MPRLIVLGSHHRALMTNHLLALNPHDRSERFMGMVNDGFVQRYIDGISHGRDILLGAVEEARLVGLAHVALAEHDGACTAEIGISVQADRRRHGLGKRLMVEAIACASRRGASPVEVLFHAENRSMRALVRSLGGRVTRQGIESVAVFQTPAASAVPPALRGRADTATPRRADSGGTGAAVPAW